MILMYSIFKNNMKSVLKERSYRNIQQSFIFNPVQNAEFEEIIVFFSALKSLYYKNCIIPATNTNSRSDFDEKNYSNKRFMPACINGM